MTDCSLTHQLCASWEVGIGIARVSGCVSVDEFAEWQHHSGRQALLLAAIDQTSVYSAHTRHWFNVG